MVNSWYVLWLNYIVAIVVQSLGQTILPGINNLHEQSWQKKIMLQCCMGISKITS